VRRARRLGRGRGGDDIRDDKEVEEDEEEEDITVMLTMMVAMMTCVSLGWCVIVQTPFVRRGTRCRTWAPSSRAPSSRTPSTTPLPPPHHSPPAQVGRHRPLGSRLLDVWMHHRGLSLAGLGMSIGDRPVRQAGGLHLGLGLAPSLG
jgi:hypothetical protein